MDLKEIILKDIECQENLLKKYQEQLKKLPQGNLLMIKNHDSIEYYSIDKKTRKRKYIRSEEYDIVKSLKQRRFMEKTIDIVKANIKEEKRLIKKYQEYDYINVMNIIPKAYRFDMRPKQQEQAFKTYIGGTYHETTRGLKVRSRVEALICELLYAGDLEFSYEEELILYDKDGKKIIFHPDFTFTNKITGGKFYWEHLGMLNDLHYRESNLEKLFIYAENGILPGANLFITADSIEGNMDTRAIMRTIEIIKGLV